MVIPLDFPFSVNGGTSPAFRPTSALQLALNSLDCRGIACANPHVTSEDDVQHVNEGVRRDSCQLSLHGQLRDAI
jgi:hypothetical protein